MPMASSVISNITTSASGILTVGGETMAKKKKIKTDPQGSYTGRPEIPTEKPVQDADDL